MPRPIKFVLAFFRLSKSAVCEMSVGRNEFTDFHDYPDDVSGYPWHFHEMTCKLCGKSFYI